MARYEVYNSRCNSCATKLTFITNLKDSSPNQSKDKLDILVGAAMILCQLAFVGCTNLYQRETRQVLKELLSLPYLPADQKVPVFQAMRERNDVERLEELFKYMSDTWINNPTYPVEAWSAYGRAVRTNNDCEGWHHRLNGRAGGKALGVYGLVVLLHREAAVVHLTVRLINLKRLTKRQKKRAATAQGRVFILWEQHREGLKSPEELLRACSHIHGNVVA
ncbi:uncharacterized protein LOC121424214 [Lytechinus variegatus]|uniref:uncharacterized protein LOC121424214 n=1 Tax=Lytechinus variegatus TaxID=7654 RepID=UPI001BB17DFA|nr:uncharacterized protein LOC121424214 [Lytechinus variegatus]